MSLNDRISKCFEENGILILRNGIFDNIDSINFISTIISLESEFDIEIPDEYLLLSLFCDINSVICIISNILDSEVEDHDYASL